MTNILEQTKELITPLLNSEEAELIESSKAQLIEQKKQVVADYIEKNPSVIPSIAGFKLFDKSDFVDFLVADDFGDSLKSKIVFSLLKKDDLIALHKKINEAMSIESLRQELGLLAEEVQEKQDTSDENSIQTTEVSTTSAAIATDSSATTDEISRENHEISSDEYIKEQYSQLKGREKPDFEPFAYAMKGLEKLKSEVKNQKYLTVVDYSKSNQDNRFFVINMETKEIEYAVPVGHGKRSGGEFAKSFSDRLGSNQSSLGFYRTPEAITKANTKKWSGLLLRGIEESNDNAASRGIYIHPAPVNGSEGCFTLPEKSTEIMEKIKGDSLLFAYYPDDQYLAHSEVLNQNAYENYA